MKHRECGASSGVRGICGMRGRSQVRYPARDPASPDMSLLTQAHAISFDKIPNGFYLSPNTFAVVLQIPSGSMP